MGLASGCRRADEKPSKLGKGKNSRRRRWRTVGWGVCAIFYFYPARCGPKDHGSSGIALHISLSCPGIADHSRAPRSPSPQSPQAERRRKGKEQRRNNEKHILQRARPARLAGVVYPGISSAAGAPSLFLFLCFCFSAVWGEGEKGVPLWRQDIAWLCEKEPVKRAHI